MYDYVCYVIIFAAFCVYVVNVIGEEQGDEGIIIFDVPVIRDNELQETDLEFPNSNGDNIMS